MARKAKICGSDTTFGVPVYSSRLYRKFRSLLGAMMMGEVKADPHAFLAFVRSVRDRLSIFLEMIDRCDVLYSERVGGSLVFIVLTDNEDHLSLIAGALAQERRMLDELGIDPREIETRGDLIRISVPLPGGDITSLN